MKETVMKNGLALLHAMDNIPAGMITDSAIPAADAPVKKEKGASFWERINTNVWVAAAIGLVVAFGVVVLIIRAGRGAGGPTPIGGTAAATGTNTSEPAAETETADPAPIETVTLPGTPIIIDPKIDPFPIDREELPVLTTLPESRPFDTSYTSADGWCEGFVIGITEDGRYLLQILGNMYLLLRITDETQVDIDLDSVYWDDLFLFSYDTVNPPEAEGQPSSVDALIVKRGIAVEKPVIYLYPTEPTECSLRVDLDGRLTCTYPDHGRDGWRGFTAHPDGTLVFPDGREYYCLYWEGVQDTTFDFSSGFCVRGEDTAAFLADALPRLGLSAREANEMIIYWLPQMQGNAYNVISFQTDAYTSTAPLDVAPAPDTVIRVFMAWYGTSVPVNIPAQTLTAPARDGFVLVEWGGAECR